MPSLKDRLLDETVLFKNRNRLKVDYTRVRKKLLDRLGKNVSRGPSLKDPPVDETVLFKTGIGLKCIMYESEK